MVGALPAALPRRSTRTSGSRRPRGRRERPSWHELEALARARGAARRARSPPCARCRRRRAAGLPAPAPSSAFTAAICSAVKNFARLPRHELPSLVDVDRRGGARAVPLDDLVEAFELRARHLAARPALSARTTPPECEHRLEDLELGAANELGDVVDLEPEAGVGLVAAEPQHRLGVAIAAAMAAAASVRPRRARARAP